MDIDSLRLSGPGAALIRLWTVLLALIALPGICPAQTMSSSIMGRPTSNAVVYVTEIRPQPEYARWYASAERCLGMQGAYDKVQWFVTPNPWSDHRHGNGLTYGVWRPPHKIILNRPEALDSTLVIHEAVHDILGANGIDQSRDEDQGHPLPYFDGRCTYRYHS
jgi:hypothetical protein